MTREHYQRVLDHIDTRMKLLVPNDEEWRDSVVGNLAVVVRQQHEELGHLTDEEAARLYQKIEGNFPDLAESLRRRGYLP